MWGIAGARPRDEGPRRRVFQHLGEHADPLTVDDIADDMQRLLDDWYAKIGQLVQQFREKYDAEATEIPTEATSEPD